VVKALEREPRAVEHLLATRPRYSSPEKSGGREEGCSEPCVCREQFADEKRRHSKITCALTGILEICNRGYVQVR